MNYSHAAFAHQVFGDNLHQEHPFLSRVDSTILQLLHELFTRDYTSVLLKEFIHWKILQMQTNT